MEPLKQLSCLLTELDHLGVLNRVFQLEAFTQQRQIKEIIIECALN